MSKRYWVVNASPIITLAKVGQASWLEALCAALIIPTAVAAEISAGENADAGKQWLTGSGQKYVQASPGLDPLILGWNLGAGESAVLTWARQHPEYEVILDDRAARNCAISFRIPVRGTLGVVLLAKREGQIEKAAPVFRALIDVGLRIAPEVLEKALSLAGE